MSTIDVMSRVQDEVIRVQEEFWAALKGKSRDGFERVLAEDFVSRSPDEDNQDRAQFVRALTAFPAHVLHIGSDSIEVHLLGDTAVLTGVQTARLRFGNGEQMDNRLAITNLFRRDGEGSWRMVFTHSVELQTV